MLGSSLTAFMVSPSSNLKLNLMIKFSSYEYYQHELSIDDNTTLIQAVSSYYYVRLSNDSLYCIRNSCNGNGSKWLAFDAEGYLVTPETYIVSSGETLYMIYNTTSVVNVNENKDNEAIKKLLKIE